MRRDHRARTLRTDVRRRLPRHQQTHIRVKMRLSA